ncbi:SWIM zinc finger family protein, partial [Mesorhizobium sp.]|uniref:SWIM zinc finger family protein n=1 Tax=Mesorhizobium sp. TaxID=1871066 RepID=UPI000FE9CA83
MQLDLKTIEALAPDQASLGAAAKLTKRSNWPRLETNEQLGLIWGECQGSGANPYRVAFDARDHGYKCTCPSRKFPCKHILGLMWIGATAPASFDRVDQTPEWVNDWLGRLARLAAPP